MEALPCFAEAYQIHPELYQSILLSWICSTHLLLTIPSSPQAQAAAIRTLSSNVSHLVERLFAKPAHTVHVPPSSSPLNFAKSLLVKTQAPVKSFKRPPLSTYTTARSAPSPIHHVRETTSRNSPTPSPPHSPNISDQSTAKPGRSWLTRFLRKSTPNSPSKERHPLLPVNPQPVEKPNFGERTRQSSRTSSSRWQADPNDEEEVLETAQYACPTILILTGLEHADKEIQRTLLSSLRSRRVEIEDGDEEIQEGHYLIPKEFMIVAIVTRAEETYYDGGLPFFDLSNFVLDRFGFSVFLTVKQASTRLHLPAAPTTEPIMSPKLVTAIRDFTKKLNISYLLSRFTSDLLSCIKHHQFVAAAQTMLGTSCRPSYLINYAATLLCLVSPGFMAAIQSGHDFQEEMVMVPEHIRRILRTALQHRVVIRKPEDELSQFWGDRVKDLAARRSDYKSRKETLLEVVFTTASETV